MSLISFSNLIHSHMSSISFSNLIQHRFHSQQKKRKKNLDELLLSPEAGPAAPGRPRPAVAAPEAAPDPAPDVVATRAPRTPEPRRDRAGGSVWPRPAVAAPEEAPPWPPA
jgi:hypothetical protein